MANPLVVAQATKAYATAKEVLASMEAGDVAINPNHLGNPNMIKKLALAVCDLAEAILKS